MPVRVYMKIMNLRKDIENQFQFSESWFEQVHTHSTLADCPRR